MPPGKNEACFAGSSSAAVSAAVLGVLSTMSGERKGEPTPEKRRTRINVIQGNSVSLEYLSAPSSIASLRSTTPTPTCDKQRERESFFPYYHQQRHLAVALTNLLLQETL
ncbi:hypothetical protein PoB_006976200 [Plakobranchus ocellatus]|uniref:Uncharacterized protein n=1 Tax=Plakobranchus ocellatus TaxID=259542 RepID=A0AAV4DG81_9GAST|nr:hypothetical protein PoB_006976200 [Plakobranchus ocellatus]